MTNVLQKGATITIAFSLLMLGIVPFVALGQAPTPVSGITDVSGFFGILDNITSILYTLFFIIAVIMLLWAAFVYLTAGGDEEKVGKAKSIIIYAVIAIVVALLAYAVPGIVASLL